MIISLLVLFHNMKCMLPDKEIKCILSWRIFFYFCAEWKQTNHHQQHPPLIHKPNNWSQKAYQPLLQVREFLLLHPHPHLLHFALISLGKVALCSGRQKMCEMYSTKGVRLYWDIKQADSINLKETLQREAGTLCQVGRAGLQILFHKLSVFNRPPKQMYVSSGED